MPPLAGRAPQATVLALQCLLSGSWRSDTGCRMVVSVLSKDGRFSGSYLPGPAAGNSEILTSPLEGSQQDARLVPHPTFSFIVHWQLRGRQEGAITLQRGCQRDAAGGGFVPTIPTHATLDSSRLRHNPDDCLPGPVLHRHQRGRDPACPVAPARGGRQPH